MNDPHGMDGALLGLTAIVRARAKHPGSVYPGDTFTMAHFEQKVIDLISRKFHVAPEKLRPDLELKRDLRGSDLDVIELLMAIEKDCGVEITGQRAERLRTVGDACRLASYTA